MVPTNVHLSAAQHGDPPDHPVTIHLNERPVTLPSHTATGAEIKAAAIDAGVPIQPDFILVEEIGSNGRTRVIGDDDVVHLNPELQFLANDGDDNS